jgi:hypothetical protein
VYTLLDVAKSLCYVVKNCASALTVGVYTLPRPLCSQIRVLRLIVASGFGPGFRVCLCRIHDK